MGPAGSPVEPTPEGDTSGDGAFDEGITSEEDSVESFGRGIGGCGVYVEDEDVTIGSGIPVPSSGGLGRDTDTVTTAVPEVIVSTLLVVALATSVSVNCEDESVDDSVNCEDERVDDSVNSEDRRVDESEEVCDWKEEKRDSQKEVVSDVIGRDWTSDVLLEDDSEEEEEGVGTAGALEFVKICLLTWRGK